MEVAAISFPFTLIQVDSAQCTKPVLINNKPTNDITPLTWPPGVTHKDPRESRNSGWMLIKELVKRSDPWAHTPASPVCPRHDPAHKHCPGKGICDFCSSRL